jgi:ribosomal protein S18 acetylase RimI-like enzyme
MTTLFQDTAVGAPATAPADPITIDPIGPDDTDAVVAFMHRFPEVHFCEWEDAALLAQAIHQQKPRASFVARDAAGGIVGAVIAGSVGVRGTISHVAVAPEARRRGIASGLVRRSLGSFREAGVRRIFLFVVDEAQSGRAFWQAQGFRTTLGETTMEVDV